jgi:uncharacterized protein (TIGR02284 family)
MAASDDMNTAVESLIETCKDAERGFQEAAKQAQAPILKKFFSQQSRERGNFVRELEDELSRLGEQGHARIGGRGVRERGSVAGALHRAWIDLKTSLGAGDHGLLATVEAAEDRARDAYEEALKAPLPEPMRAVVSAQAVSVRAAHDRVRELRDQMAA